MEVFIFVDMAWSLVLNHARAARNRHTQLRERLVTDMILDHEHWSQNAAEWIAWARTPNHDAFWAYRSSLLTFIGQGEGEALDVGCGEGRISRLLKECGYRVTATDPVEAFIAASEQAGSADDYKIARRPTSHSRTTRSIWPLLTMC